ncbi:MAG: GLPGLI family protein [Flavihumibacter sp.]
MIGPAKSNIVYTNFKTLEYHSRRKVFEENFEIVDSLSKISWRLTSETRTIAGFECRKAVGIICDSVYITAFYTNDIPVSGGPESFGGLPGMILGLAVPRLYSTWFATKVELTEPPATAFTPAKAGRLKKMNAAELAPFLKNTFTDWGSRGAKFIWWSML